MKRQNIYCRTKRGSQETTGGIGGQHTEKRSTATIPQAALEVCTLTSGQLPWTSHGGLLWVPLGVSTVRPH